MTKLKPGWAEGAHDGGTGGDATGRKRAEELLEFQAHILSQLDDAVVAVDTAGRITYWNAPAERMYGLRVDEVLGRPLEEAYRYEWVAPEDEQAASEALAGTGRWRGENIHTAVDGRHYHVEASVIVLRDEHGEPAGLLAVIRDVTERRHAEDALRESRADLNRAQAVAKIGSWRLKIGTNELLWSDETHRMFGVPQGTPLTYEMFLGTVHPDDREYVAGEWQAALRGERDYDAEHRVIVGEAVKWVRERAELEFDAEGALLGGFGTVQDVTERKRADEALRESEERERARAEVLRAVMDAAPAGIILAEAPDMHVVYANRRARELYEGRDLGAVPIEERARYHRHPDGTPYRPEEMPVLRAALHGEVVHGEEMVLSVPQGGERVLDVHAAPVRACDGRIKSAVVAIQDVTDRTAAEEALREADRRKDEFLAMLGHELRNPLAAISSAVQLLQMRGTADAVQRKAQGIAARQSQHMARLLDDLLDVSRITQGKITLRDDETDLSRVIESAVEASSPRMEANAHQLHLEIERGGVRVKGDSVRLVQVVGNLLNNAATYTPPGGEIHLSLQRDGDHAVLRVRDNGVGIPTEALPHVFDLFVQGERSLARAEGGLGIGLTMVRRLVELHGGRVEAHSEGPGRGSEFVVRLPLSPQSAVHSPRSAVRSPQSTVGSDCGPGAVDRGLRTVDRGLGTGACGLQTADGGLRTSPVRILVVDDNAEAAEALAMALEMDGHEVVTAHNGPAALAMAAGCPPDVILLDLGMPGMDGCEVARRLRRDPVLAGATLVALTGYGQDEDQQRTRAAGFDHHLVKPVGMETLRELLRHVGRRV